MAVAFNGYLPVFGERVGAEKLAVAADIQLVSGGTAEGKYI